jgi:hypothetical protein
MKFKIYFAAEHLSSYGIRYAWIKRCPAKLSAEIRGGAKEVKMFGLTLSQLSYLRSYIYVCGYKPKFSLHRLVLQKINKYNFNFVFLPM